jgi:hypothetical protein
MYDTSESDIQKITMEINKFSRFMCNFIREKYSDILKKLEIEGRNRSITINDAILHKLLYTQKGEPFTQQGCANKINFEKGKKIHRTSYTKKQIRLNSNFYNNLSSAISDYVYKEENIEIYDDQIYLVDGTRMYANIIISIVNGYKMSTSETFTDLLGNVVYDVNIKIPISFNVPKNTDEREAFLEFIRKNDKYRKAIFIFDRGYFSYYFISELKKYGIRFIMRLENTYKFITHNKDEYEVCLLLDNRIQKIRVVNYEINNNEYILATNLYDKDKYSINTLAQYYRRRWDVEEFIKSCKKYTKCEVKFFLSGRSTTENHIHEMIYTNMIMTKIETMIEKIINKYLLPKYNKLNKKCFALYSGIYDKLLPKLLSDKEIDSSFIERSNFCNAYVQYIPIQEYRYFDRKCDMPVYKWWVKQDISIQHQKENIIRQEKYRVRKNNKKNNKQIHNPIYIVRLNGRDGKITKIISEKNYLHTLDKNRVINDND